MRVCVLHPSYERSSSAFRELDAPCDPSRYLPEHEWHDAYLHKATAVAELNALVREGQGFDVFVNLCDGAADEDRAGIEVVEALESLGQAFTGAGSVFYDPSRALMKEAAARAEVDTPAGVFVKEEGELERALALEMPLIVKHPMSYGSIGLTPASRVADREALMVEGRRAIATFGGALVEQFIDGREFTVLVSEPRAGETAPWALTPVEMHLPRGESFLHFDIKWGEGPGVSWSPVEAREPALSRRLREASSRFFAALDGSGYGRCDLRLDASGRLFMLEINPNCAIFQTEGNYFGADNVLEHDPAGHRGFLEHLLLCALRRQRRARER